MVVPNNNHQSKHHLPVAIFILLASLLIVFFPVIFGNKTLQVSDNKYGGMLRDGLYGFQGHDPDNLNLIDPAAVSWQFQPLFRLVEQLYSEKTLPLWNPHSGTGAPLAADMQSSAFFPPLILFSFFSGWQANLDLYFLFRLFIAGIFTYLLCRRLKLSFWSSLIAADLFMLNGYFIGYINQAHINVEVLLPAIVWGIESFIQQQRKICLIFISSIAFLFITGGMPESAFLAFLFASGYALVRIFPDSSKKTLKEKTLQLFHIFLAFLAGIGFASFLLIPFLEFLFNSAHYHDLKDPRELWWAGLYYVNFPALGSYFLPKILPSTQAKISAWFAYGGEVGIGTFSIIGFSLFILAFKDLKKFSLKLYLLSWIILVFGKIFHFSAFTWIGELPIFNQIVLVKFPILELNFAVALLSGLGWEMAQKNKKRALIWLTSGSLLMIALIVSFAVFYLKIASDRGVSNVLFSYFVRQISTGVAGILVFWNLSYLRIFSNQEKKIDTITSLGLILLIVFISLQNTVNGWQKKYDPFTKPAVLSRLDREGRILGINSLHPNLTVPLGIANLRNNNALYPLNFAKFMENVVIIDPPYDLLASFNQYNLASTSLDFLNLKYLVTDKDEDIKIPEKYSTLGNDDELRLYKNKQALPRASIFYNYVVEPDASKAFALMRKIDFDFRKVIVLNKYPPIRKIYREDKTNKIMMSVDTPLYLKFAVKTNSPGVFSLSDTHFPGWIAKVNNKETDILLVNTFVRGIPLNKGSHVVEFIYRPRSWIDGGLLSLLILTGYFIYIINLDRLFRK